MKKVFLVLAALFLFLFFKMTWVKADELDDIEKQLKDLKSAYEQSVAATTPLEKEVTSMQRSIESLQIKIKSAEKQLKDLEQSIFDREVDLGVQQKLLESRVKSWYIRQQDLQGWEFFLMSENVGDYWRGLVYRQVAATRDKESIVSLGQRLTALANDKSKLEQDTKRLAAAKVEVQKQKTFLAGEIAKAKSYQQNLNTQIASLSARQKQLLAEKTGTFTTGVGDVPLAGDPAGRADYNPGFSPAFAGFSFGSPHFQGLSQYGARGRARQGQGFEQILKAYYGDVKIETRGDLPTTIKTSAGTLSLEDAYLMGIAEMPSDWTENNLAALKSQAIAARTYALSYVGWRVKGGSASGTICTSEQCQVYSASKRANTPDSWKRAVQETRGMVVVSNSTGDIFGTRYAASSGGYQDSYTSVGHTTPGIWDTICGSQGCWTGDAYEKIAESPWFYKGWYQSRTGQNCGRKHPWLTEAEFADIINVMIVGTHDSGAVGHLSQADTCLSKDPSTWNKDQVRSEADKYGGAVSRISAVQSIYGTNGVTSKIVVQTDKGAREFSGKDFKLLFNLRAPDMLHIRSGLFNVEKK